ncbi:sulfatase-like hydrolase/transferase [Rhodococcus marinonascens]|uniref:sulfatase-like hydrolase/transferase n=1 Tax=Rhodococcus marinonascens TaxID=38311 RepID=UPI0009326A3B|nr:sulfatase-like hydrolase/transferase [Rhodococcus marinonascens]
MMRAPRFEGTIGRTLAESQPWYDEPPHPGREAPNVVVVLLDDTGFAQLGCYGSDIDTPNVDALAENGLQFTNFHVAPVCSPTRAALLTGRSQHAVGMRSVANFRTGFPHQLGHITSSASTIAEVLRGEGYATFCVGKWHLTPSEQCSAAGPFDHWPLARGFDRFYGFLDGETDQFHPQLVCDNHPIDPPGQPEDGYHLSEDLVEQALAMVTDSKGVRPDRPFFLYLPFGATHSPHQAPASYLSKYRGKYEDGWDVWREKWFERQLETGVVPPGTQPQASAAIGGRSFHLTARVTRTAGQDGVLFATGNENSGISVFVQAGRLVVDYNAFGDHSIVESDDTIPAGDATLVARVARGPGRSGLISIEVNGQAAGSVDTAAFMRMISSTGSSIGRDHGSAVSTRYQAPFAFAGKLHELEIRLADDEDPATRSAEAAEEMRRQ